MKLPTTIFSLTKRDNMIVLKEHTIPDLIKIQLIQYTSAKNGPYAHAAPTYEIHWRFWRTETNFSLDPPRAKMGWAGANWSHATTTQLEAEQWFDLAVARVSSLLIMGKDIPIDIMHDYNDMGLQIS